MINPRKKQAANEAKNEVTISYKSIIYVCDNKIPERFFSLFHRLEVLELDKVMKIQ